LRKQRALAGKRYDRGRLLAVVDEVTTNFHTPKRFESSKMRAACRYLADALDQCRSACNSAGTILRRSFGLSGGGDQASRRYVLYMGRTRPRFRHGTCATISCAGSHARCSARPRSWRRGTPNRTQVACGCAHFVFRPLRLSNRIRLSLQALRSAHDSSDAPHLYWIRLRKSKRTRPSPYYSHAPRTGARDAEDSGLRPPSLESRDRSS
jgi:hypothetical protein